MGRALDVQLGDDPVEPRWASTSSCPRAAPSWPARAACGRRWRRAGRPAPGRGRTASSPVVLEHERAEHDHHDGGGGGDDPCGRGEAVGHGAGGVAGLVVLLANPREQEDLVVHREPEHDGEQHQRQHRLDRPAVDADEVGAPAPLEDRDEHAVGRADRQDVHDDGLERHEERSEDHHQEQERQRQHGAEEDERAAGEEVGEVDVGGGRPGDLDVERRAGDRGRDDVVAQRLDQFGGGRVLGCGRGDEVEEVRLRVREPDRFGKAGVTAATPGVSARARCSAVHARRRCRRHRGRP